MRRTGAALTALCRTRVCSRSDASGGKIQTTQPIPLPGEGTQRECWQTSLIGSREAHFLTAV